MQFPKIRTMQDAYNLIKESDPNTSLSFYLFRQMILNKEIPSIKTGGRYLLNMDQIEACFSTKPNTSSTLSSGEKAIEETKPAVIRTVS